MDSLSTDERTALAVATDTYEAVRHSEVMDGVEHWQRFANRLASAGYAQTAPAYLRQVSKRFGVAHTPGPALEELLAAEPATQRRVLRVLRAEANALSVLVRADRDNRRSAK